MSDNVNQPAHYADGLLIDGYQPIDFCRHLDYLRGNAFKYVCRAEWKGNAREDYAKAERYLVWWLGWCEDMGANGTDGETPETFYYYGDRYRFSASTALADALPAEPGTARYTPDDYARAQRTLFAILSGDPVKIVTALDDLHTLAAHAIN